jgi:hypothetical protein
VGTNPERLRLRAWDANRPQRTPGSVSADWEESVRRLHHGAEAAILPAHQVERFRTDWEQLRTDFANDPRSTLEQANRLMGSLLQQIEDRFSSERERLEQDWDERGGVSTEELRIALTRYRNLFERLLAA